MKAKITHHIKSVAVCIPLLFAIAIFWQVTTSANGGDSKVPRQAATVTPTGGTPQYQIYDIGVVQVGDEASQGFGVSSAGIAVGRSLSNTGSQAFTWVAEPRWPQLLCFQQR